MDFKQTRTTQIVVTTSVVANGLDDLHGLFSNVHDQDSNQLHAQCITRKHSPIKVLELNSRYAIAAYAKLFDKGIARGEDEKLLLIDTPDGLAMINFTRVEWQMNTVNWLDSSNTIEEIMRFIKETPGLAKILAPYYAEAMKQLNGHYKARLGLMAEEIMEFAAALRAPEPAAAATAVTAPTAAAPRPARPLRGGLRLAAQGGGGGEPADVAGREAPKLRVVGGKAGRDNLDL
jgi:hypothetical protein